MVRNWLGTRGLSTQGVVQAELPIHSHCCSRTDTTTWVNARTRLLWLRPPCSQTNCLRNSGPGRSCFGETCSLVVQLSPTNTKRVFSAGCFELCSFSNCGDGKYLCSLFELCRLNSKQADWNNAGSAVSTVGKQTVPPYWVELSKQDQPLSLFLLYHKQERFSASRPPRGLCTSIIVDVP